MTHPLITPGQRFGKLTVVGRIPENREKSQCARWALVCDCGTRTWVRSSTSLLKYGQQSCVHCSYRPGGNQHPHVLTGKRFGLLTVLSLSDKRSNESTGQAAVMWKCRCDCGVESEIRARSLTSGNTKSCGHLKFGQKKVVLQ